MSGEFRGARVLVVSPVDGGAAPMGRHVAEALLELGVEARLMSFSWLAPPGGLAPLARSPEIRASLVEYASALVIAEHTRLRPDLTFVLSQAPLSERATDALRKSGSPVAMWFVENYRLTRSWRFLAPRYDLFFTVQRGPFHEELVRSGCAKAHWLPMACNPRRHRPRRLAEKAVRRYGSDVSFAGYGYYNRRQFFGGLSDFDFKIWGRGWDESPVADLVQEEGRAFEESDLLQIASASKIHVNLHSASHVDGIDPDGDYVNPRTFELAACGAFQMVDPRRDLQDLFTPEVEIPLFHDIGELRRRIIHYLDHPESRRDAALAARKTALGRHTYRHRMSEVLTLALGSVRSAAATVERAAPSVSLPEMPALPRLSRRSFRSTSELFDLLDELEREREVTDEEVVLRLALPRSASSV
jgi:spore maturation protein CgeB